MNSKNNKNFIHLRNYTQYSLSRGAIKINELISFCKKNKIPAVSITDFNNLFGCMEFSLECKKNGIQPIIGCNLFLKDSKFDSGYILLLCKSEAGFRNLSKLVSFSSLENSNNSEAYVNFTNLAKYNKDLICLAGGEFGIITNNFENRDLYTCNTLTNYLISIYQDNFFFEIQRTKEKKKNLENFLIINSQKRNIPLVATNENFFLKENFFHSHDALLSISEQKYIESEDRLKSSSDYFYKDSETLSNIFADIPFVIKNTQLIAKKCSFFVDENPTSLPKIFSNRVDENEMLISKSKSGLNNRLKKYMLDNSFNTTEYNQRLDYELKIIIKMGYASYFLIVSDFILWAKSNNIPVGPGRGSGAGSLVAWCLQITDLDPLKFGLLFERFLNPERVSLPDFDIDFCMDKRDEVINYVKQKYGNLNVAQIITFGSFQARVAIRDVGRVMQLPLNQVDEICKMIPYNPSQPVSLKESVGEEKIQKLIKHNNNLKKLFKISIDLEGLYRHASTHAAGIVISDKSLLNILPLYKDPKSDIPVTQFSMKYVEKIGLIKFDFLGLKTLTVISKAQKYLHQRSVKLNLDELPLNDAKTFNLLKNGDTTGVFQLEGQGMKETLKKIMPDRFEDIIAVVSLYRPGPMDNIPTYINRKQKKESYKYLHPSIEEVLKETYGIMVYQEQVMLIAQKVAGFNLAKADLLRRAMGKKIKSEMQAQRSNFIEGCLKNKLSNDIAIDLFNEIEKFAGYGFNKSHAAAYAMIAYQTAYLKANYPLEFFCSLMNCDIGNFEKISSYCYEIKKLNFKIFSPDINKSDVFFSVVYNKKKNPIGISYGLSAIKNIGENSVIYIIDERKKNGNFSSLQDFFKRVNNKVLNKKILEALIFSGSLDSVEKNQNFLIKKIDKFINLNSSFHKNVEKNQINLFTNFFDENEFSSKSFKHSTFEEKLSMEFESFGFYLSDHPSKFYKSLNYNKKIDNLITLNEFETNSNDDHKSFECICLISELNERKSKIGKRFCFFNLSDDTGILDTICFSEVLDSLDNKIKVGNIVQVKLHLQQIKDSKRFVVNSIKILDHTSVNSKNYMISLNVNDIDYTELKNLLTTNEKGESNLYFKIFHTDYEIEVKSNYKYLANLDLLHSIKNLNGVLDIQEIN